MAKPAPKNNMMQTLLFAAMLFMAFSLFQNSQKPQPVTEKVQDMRAALIDLNGKYRDAQILAKKGAYESRLDADFEAAKKGKSAEEVKKLQDELDAKKMEAEVLVADAALRAAIVAKEREKNPAGGFNAATNAYIYLKPLEKKNEKSPLWTTPISVGSDKYPFSVKRDITPKELLAEARDKSSEMGRSTPVWGFFPGFQVVDFLVGVTGRTPAFSYAFAGLLLAICVRGVIWKLAQKQLMWSRQMAQLTPLTNELKEKFTGQELQVKIMELYKTYGMNPMAGCLPMFIQMPLFLLIYQSMLHYRFEFQKGTFLWVGSGLVERFPGIIAPNLGERDYPLIVIYGVSMIVTTLLTPVSDPSNAKQQRMMGLSMSVMFAIMMFFWPIPSAFVLYWIFTNILATAQSLRAYRLPLPPLVKVNAPGGGVYPVTNGKPTAERYKSTGTPKVHKPKRAKKK
jgi:YidC/Oxa1 family membrane protein insertase